jgi:hypothetical protein
LTTPQITGGKKQSDEGAALFAVRVNLPGYTPVNLFFKNLFLYFTIFLISYPSGQIRVQKDLPPIKGIPITK